MSPEDRLAAFLGEDVAEKSGATSRSAGDQMFVAEVMGSIARRELSLKLVSATATATAVGSVLWACAPVLNLAVRNLAPALMPAGAILALTAAAWLLGGQMLSRR